MKNTTAETETLFCEAGQHEFTRERKRGVKPKICPQHKAERDQAAAAERSERAEEAQTIVRPDAEAVDAEIARTGIVDRKIAEAFVSDGVPAPTQAAIDERGFSAADLKTISKFYAAMRKPDAIDAELSDPALALDK